MALLVCAIETETMQDSFNQAELRPVNVVAMGGGTGLSTLLHGLKQYVAHGRTAAAAELPASLICRLLSPSATTAAPADGCARSSISLRRVTFATASSRSPKRKRCCRGSSSIASLPARALGGHSFGNLFLSAMTAITGDFSQAIKHSSTILATRGHIYPATTGNAQLYAIMDDGSIVRGETNITASHHRIVELRMEPANAEPLPMAHGGHRECGPDHHRARVAVHQPGTQSAGAGRVAGDRATRAAVKVFVCNLMTQANESLDLTASDHIRASTNTRDISSSITHS